jgi:uncharacterized damage-inducible protein DinB
MKTINSFLEYYEGVRKRTNRLLKSIPQEHFEFAYKQGKFTIADQIRHIAAIKRLMFAETVSGGKSLYRGCGKELADGYENVLSYFNQSHNETCEIIGSLTDEDLQQNCLTPTGVEISIKKWLQFLVEHEIHHRAQLYIYLNMLDVKTPPMYGLTSEQLTEFSK